MTDTKKHAKIPQFKNRQELAAFWDTHDVTEYLDELKPVTLHFQLDEPKQETVILRLNTEVKAELAKIARAKGLNISSLVRMWLMERLQTRNV